MIVAGMVTGADSIDDLDVVRHGGMPALFDECYAPSTLGSFLREFTFGHTRQLGAAARTFLVELTSATPLLPGAEQITYVDVDSLLRRVLRQSQGGRQVRPRQGRRILGVAAGALAAGRDPVHPTGGAGDRGRAASPTSSGGPLAHLPSGSSTPTAPGCSAPPWRTTCSRAAGALTGRTSARARSATLRRQIVNIAARLAHRAHGIDLHLPEYWPWTGHWQLLFDTTHRPAPT